MKTLQDLAVIRDEMKQVVNTREAAHDNVRVVVNMGTCGISAGARAVLNAFTNEVAKHNLDGVLVTQNGNVECSTVAPIVEVTRPGTPTTVYAAVTPEKVAKIVEEHLINGNVVTEYTLETVSKEQK